MKIVAITYKTKFAYSLFKMMERNNISIEAIIMEKPRPSKRLRNAFKRLTFIQIITLGMKKGRDVFFPIYKSEWRKNSCYSKYSDKIYVVDDINSHETEKLIQDIQSDLIVLGSASILSENIVNIPKIGIINSHPGLLPKYRGLDTVEWAIYNNDDIGVTVHFVDKGVDTGSIVMQDIVTVEPRDTIGTINKKVNKLRLELLIQSINKFKDCEKIDITPQPLTGGKQYYKMSRNMLLEVKARLKNRVRELV